MTSSRPFLLLQLRPEDVISDDEYHAILRYGGLAPEEVVRVRLERDGFPALELERYSGIIVGGSPFDISAPRAEKSALQLSLERGFHDLFEHVLPEDFPFLGACSGNGLLGHHLGAAISRRYGEPVCARTLTLTPEGKQDRLLAGFPDEICVLLGHKEACDGVPGGATLLVTGSECPVQMFRVGENVYATQFHPEADGGVFENRVRVYQDHGYFDREESQGIIDAVRDVDTPHAHAILSRFVETFRRPR